MKPLPKIHQELLDWIETYIAEYDHSPSIRQMMEGMGLRSPWPVQKRLEYLRKHGYLDWTDGKARTYKVLRAEAPSEGIPVLGAIAAGSLVETFADDEVGQVNLTDFFLSMGRSRHEVSQYFALKVRGDSMIEALIDNGDLVVMKPPIGPVKNGTIVSARVEGQTTLKYFHQKGETVTLQPANSNYSPMQVEAERVDVQGIYVGVIRDLV